jgi:anaerobic selenocysteine-containing dehydrogenase
MCDGWPALRERALQWPPERAAAVCGITADEVRELARDYGTTQPAAIRLNYGMQRVHGGGSAVRLVALLPCLVTGAWRHRAGGLLLSAARAGSRPRATTPGCSGPTCWPAAARAPSTW